MYCITYFSITESALFNWHTPYLIHHLINLTLQLFNINNIIKVRYPFNF